jgi:hypothetical protein
MRRRDVIAAVSAVAVTGCLGGPEAGSGDSGGSDTEFTLTDAGCGSIREDASVAVDGSTVSVTGTTSAPNGCYTAELASATIDDGALRVTIAAVQREGVDQCVQCITELAYEATVAVAGSLPDRVEVVHRSRGEDHEVASVDV